MIDKVWSSLLPGIDTYMCFDYLGRFPLAPINDDYNIDMAFTPSLGLLSKEVVEALSHLAGDFVMSKTTNVTVDVSVRKCDKEPVYDFLNCPYFEQAVRILYERNEKALATDFLSPDEILDSLDVEKSSGFIAGRSGFRTKNDWLNAGYLNDIYQESVLDEIPIWKFAGKIEPIERKKYVEDFKQRTFIISPVELVWHAKRLFGRQNHNLKGWFWSAYGFNPYEGGVSDLAHYLHQGLRFHEWDGVSWDRLAAWMPYIYHVRCLGLAPDLFLEWVTKNHITSYCVLPNGDFIYKSWGNNSGSSNTTGDNILGMELIQIHSVLRLSRGDEKALESFFFKDFGDDSIGSDCYNCSDEELRDCIEGTFKLYGVKLDPFLISTDLNNHSFLGFKFKQIVGGWIPKYDIGVVANTFLRVQHKIKPEGEVNKLMSALLMSAGSGEDIYNLFRAAFLEVISNTEMDLCALIKRRGVPLYQDVIDWYLGVESDSLFSSFFERSQDCFKALGLCGI